MKAKTRIAHWLFAVSSWLKAAGKMLLPRSIVVDALSLPGWFILDECIIHQTPLSDKKIAAGFQWDYWPMPDDWITEMNKLKGKHVERA